MQSRLIGGLIVIQIISKTVVDFWRRYYSKLWVKNYR